MSKNASVHALVQLCYYRNMEEPPLFFNQDRPAYPQADSDADTEEAEPAARRVHRRNRNRRQSRAQRRAERKSILVYNMPDDINRRELTDAFKVYGYIRQITIPLDSEYDTMGYAYIEYKHRQSSFKAIMDRNHKIFGTRVLKVESKRSYLNKVARRRAQGRPYYDVVARRRRYDHH